TPHVEQSASRAPGPAAAPAAPTAGPTDVPAASVVATPVVPEKTPEELAAAWVGFWNKGDYGAMYDLLSASAQRSIARDAFIDRYQAIAERGGLTGLHAAVAGGLTPGRQMPIAVDYDSSLVGRFSEQNAIPFTRDDGAWRVAWTPSLIFAGLGPDGCVDVDVQPVRRGTIFDRNGEPLAYDGTVERVGVVPEQIPASDHDRVLKALSDLTGSPVDTLDKQIAAADPTWFVQIKDFPATRGQELLNVISGLPGVSVHSATARVYPLGAQAAHVTGYVSPATAEELAVNPDLAPGQLIGQAGVEAGADDLLSGKPGVRLIVVGCQSRVERATIAARPAVPSSDIALTIDRGLQVATDAALRAQGNVKGSAVVLDPRDGAVLALASLPTYDPNGFILGFNSSERAQINSDTLRPLLDRAAQAAYPTGSIFKVITFSAAIEDLHDTPETVIDCPSTFQLAGSSQVWQDWTVAEGLGPQGPMTLHKALVNSCNTVFYQIGRDLDETDPELLPKMAKAFGLGAPTGIPYLPEVGGIVPDPTWKQQTLGDYWATGDAINLAIGQGFLEATPLQMAVAYAAIANGGDVLQPYIVSTIIHANNQHEPVGGRTVRSRLPLAETTVAA
ncbi:MAG TPA: penicillin-binding transpeptidase domain-containing protein, partial [Thermomicrobiales bacterium]|nr:penicillin-binding transpeptidase domain-containing protein [Thermomicrobiales bacterium]